MPVAGHDQSGIFRNLIQIKAELQNAIGQRRNTAAQHRLTSFGEHQTIASVRPFRFQQLFKGIGQRTVPKSIFPPVIEIPGAFPENMRIHPERFNFIRAGDIRVISHIVKGRLLAEIGFQKIHTDECLFAERSQELGAGIFTFDGQKIDVVDIAFMRRARIKPDGQFGLIGQPVPGKDSVIVPIVEFKTAFLIGPDNELPVLQQFRRRSGTDQLIVVINFKNCFGGCIHLSTIGSHGIRSQPQVLRSPIDFVHVEVEPMFPLQAEDLTVFNLQLETGGRMLGINSQIQ